MHFNFIRRRYLNVLFLLFMGCSHKEVNISNQNALSEYFETQDIRTTQKNDVLEVRVSNSGLVKNKQQRMGEKWVNAEALASVGSIIVLNSFNDSNSISKCDSIALDIQVDQFYERYSYNISLLREVNSDFETCKQFAKTISKDSFQVMKSYIENHVLKTTTDKELENFLLAVFRGSAPTRVELSAFKTLNNTTSVYTNFYYKDGTAQTYIFTFGEGEHKIGGITMPQK